MALKRVSDLPNIASEYNRNYDLSDCLLEVSHKEEDSSYKSFYAKADEFLGKQGSTDIPNASKSTYGKVKIGNNIEVEDGVISIGEYASKPPRGAQYLGTKENGDWEVKTAPTSPSTATSIYKLIDYFYPVGSIFITTTANDPPGNGLENGTGGTIQWTRLSSEFALWCIGSNNNALNSVLPASLPILNLTCNSDGKHTHTAYVNDYTSKAGMTPGSAQVVSCKSYTKNNVTVETNGAHTHTISNNSTIYDRDDNIVRPTSLGVAMWKRTA